jgi:dCTP deaminase
MILSDIDIIKLMKRKKLIITPLPKEKDVKGAHVHLYLSNRILKYKNNLADLKDDSTFTFQEVLLDEFGYRLKSGEFILGSTIEKITMPNGYFGLIQTKGNIGRAGIQVHNTDGHIDPGFSGNITLEIKNNSNRPIIIYPKIAI